MKVTAERADREENANHRREAAELVDHISLSAHYGNVSTAQQRISRPAIT